MNSWRTRRLQPESQSYNGCEPEDSSLQPVYLPDPVAVATPPRYRHTGHTIRHHAGTFYTQRCKRHHLARPNLVVRTTQETLRSHLRWRSRLKVLRE